MSNYKEKRPKKVESVAESLCCFSGYLLDLCVCVYMLLILVVMPFYNQEGFSHIGTDKSTFLRYCIVYGSRLVIPVLVVKAVTGLIVQVQKEGLPHKGTIQWKNMPAVLRKKCSVTDGFAIAFGVSVILSYLCSDYKEEALWGTTGWFMGMIPQLYSVAVYFLVSRIWKRRPWIPALVLPASAVVFILGYLNRFGIYPIDMKIQNPSFISTIGNINWYCGYLVSVFFGGMFLLWQWGKKQAEAQKEASQNVLMKWLLTGYVMVGFATLVTQGSNSGILAMGVIFLVLFGMSAQKGERMERFWLEMTLFFAVCVITYVLRAAGVLVTTFPDMVIDLFTFSSLPVLMLAVSALAYAWIHRRNQKENYPQKMFLLLKGLSWGICLTGLGVYAVVLLVNTVSGGVISAMAPAALKSALTFSALWGSRRGATWMAGGMCFGEQDILHKLTGVGPDCMAAFLYHDGSGELLAMVRESFGTARLTNAHNEWLTILVNMGLLGAVSFVGMITTAIKRYIVCYNKKANVIAGACGICLLAYTVNNMFSFQQSMSLATIFVILGIGENYARAQSFENKGNG